jgi:signal transduction histidine kinase/CheY-like chemotaxis protein
MGDIGRIGLRRLRAIFAVPHYQNIPLATPPIFIISGVLVFISFLAYLLGPNAHDAYLRSSFLIIFSLSAVQIGLHFLNNTLGRWLVSITTSLIVLSLALLWQNEILLFFLVIPIILAATSANLLVILMTAILQSITVLLAFRNGLITSFDHSVLIAVLWLVALTVSISFYIIMDVLALATKDYNRLQTLLTDSRSQQQNLSQALDDLAHLNRQLSLLYDKNISLRQIAEEATEAKSTYIAKVSHEIRTPLNMILGITESIIENREDYGDDLPLDLEDDIRIIRRNSEHLLSLVNDVLDLTRAESSQMNLRKEWVDLDHEIEKSIEIVMPLAKKKNLWLTFTPTGKLPQVFCDRTRIRQVILNLLSNAVRYTLDGGVSVSTETTEQSLFVRVRDTGPGIISEDIERIFEPFFRGQSNRNQETIGTGLGLSVSRQIVELHGGKIAVESEPNTGSTFSFSLPLLRDLDASRSPTRFINEQWAWVERKGTHQYNFLTAQKKRVVVCAQDHAFSTTLVEPLVDTVEFYWVKTIEELIAENDNSPAHLIVVNETEPEALMAMMMKAGEKIRHTPIIGSSFASPQAKVDRAGALTYVQKPFSNQHLRETVAQVTPYPRRIMIVDDNIEVQRLIARVLHLQDDTTEFLLADTGEHAFNLMRRKKPDLILLDLALPDTDGWQFLRELKSHPEWCRIDVILISAHDLEDTPPHSKIVMFMDGEGLTTDMFMNLLTNNLHLRQ